MSTGWSRLREFYECAVDLGRTPGEKWAIFWRQTKNLRVRLGLARYHPDVIYELPTRHGPVYLRDNFGDVTNLPDLFCRNVYRLGALSGEGVIFDVGANIGLFAAWAARHSSGHAIHCFEPLRSNARLIPMNCPGAVVNNVGVGRAPAQVKLAVDDHGIMASSVATRWHTHEEEFQVITLDDYTRQHGIERIAFLKMDTEGMELDIMEGGRESLRRTMRVAMETHGIDRHRESIARLEQAGLAVDEETFGGKTGFVRASRMVAASA